MVTGTLAIFFLAGGGLAQCELLSTDASTDSLDMRNACLQGDQAAIDDWEIYADGHFEHAQTMTFAVFIVFQLFNVMNCRSNEQSVVELGIFSNKAINIALMISTGLLLFFVQLSSVELPLIGIEIGQLLSTTTLTQNDWIVIVLVSSSVFVIEEFRKLLVKSKFFAIRTR